MIASLSALLLLVAPPGLRAMQNFPASTEKAPAFVQKLTAEDGTLTIQTGAHKLTATGRPDVWLVGAVHVGEAAYYKELQTLLDTQDVVLFEGVKPSKEQAEKAAAAKAAAEQSGEEVKKPEGLYTVLGEMLGLEFQNSQISYKNPNWINSDLSWDEMNELNKQAPEGSASFDTVQQLMDPNSPTAKMMVTLLKSPLPGLKDALKVFFVSKLGDSGGETTGMDAGFQKIVLHERNKAVVAEFGKVLERPEAPKSIGILYGAAHHAEIEKSLMEKYGYKVAEIKWFSAAKANPNTLDEAGKKMLEMFNKTNPPK